MNFKRMSQSQKLILFHSMSAVILILFCLFLGLVFYKTKSYGKILTNEEYEEYSKWDGVSSSKSLIGKGTLEDPYLIESAEDFIYFKSLIETKNEEYASKVYKLTTNISFENNVLKGIGTKENPFKGVFNGDGYSLALADVSGVKLDDNTYASLFNYIENAEIKNLNIKEFSIKDNSKAAILVGISKNSELKNIGIYDSLIETSESGDIAYSLNESSLYNIYTNVSSNSNYIAYTKDSKSTISDITIYSSKEYKVTSTNETNFENIYLYSDVDSIKKYEEGTFKNNSINLTTLAANFTANVYEEFTWKVDNEYIRFDNFSNVQLFMNSGIALMAMRRDAIGVHASGLENSTVYVNDLEADWNYYTSLDYTFTSEWNLPSGEYKALYTEENLVKVYMNYSSVDPANGLTGYVSLDEKYTNYIYYKYYPVVDGYVTIELIDNPFTNRPNNMGFNGWVTSYNGAKITFDKNYYTRSVTIPVTYTDNIPDTIEISLSASWTNASVYEMNGDNWSSAFSALKEEGMQVATNVPNEVYGYYRLVDIPSGQSIKGYYTSDGSLIESGTCQSGHCYHYELIQYYDASGNIETKKSNETYYYLVTRDTNIVVLKTNVNTTWSSNENKPATITSVHNGTDYRSNAIWNIENVVVNCYNDTTIENIKISSKKEPLTGEAIPTSGTTTNRYLFGRWNNIKLGRGISGEGTYTNFDYVLGGYPSNVGSDSSPHKYKLIVESGIYNSISETLGNVGTSITAYINSKTTFGSDIDRVNNNNNLLKVNFSTAGSFGGVYRSRNNSFIFDTVVKSGSYGINKADYTAGIYVGGRTSGDTHAPKRLIYEGGYTYNLIGGPITNNSRAHGNDVYIYMKGGEADLIFGGAEEKATYGNRIISVTGGTVNYSVFGGSNGHLGTSEDGTVNGSTFIYIGGNAVIGSQTNMSNKATIWGAESGSVFGIGNGRSGDEYKKIGSCDNSSIMIDGEATINGNVYGGGNFGSTGIIGYSSITTTNIKINGGTIGGNVYGGGNNNGAGASNKNSTITISMTGGLVKGSIYGGSRSLGTIYGSTYINTYAGEVEGSVYGGGEGNKTFVQGSVVVTIGNRSYEETPTIHGDVYGGSAFGTVNTSTTCSENYANYSTSTILNAGQIKGSIYGGGEGNDEYTPTVCGDVLISMNDGKVTNIYGGNDKTGKPYSDILVYLNSGYATNVYGGGNQSDIDSTEVYLNGSVVQNIYGGGNEAGAEATRVVLKNGSVTNVYGGSNQTGDVDTAEITAYDGSEENLSSDLSMEITYTSQPTPGWYGDVDFQSIQEITVNITNTSDTPIVKWTAYFRASDSFIDHNWSSVNVSVVNGTYSFDQTNKWWGNNTIPANGSFSFTFGINSYVDAAQFEIISYEIVGYDENNNVYTTVVEDLKVKNLFGGNNQGGTINNTIINLTDIEVNNIYGGGNKAVVNENAYVKLINSKVLTNVYGGGVQASVNDATVILEDSTIDGTVYGGGNFGKLLGNSKVVVQNSTVGGSIYGGGEQANIAGSSTVVVSGKSDIKESVFGGGNAGSIGSEDIPSFTEVNIIGGNIGKNVYGGCNTSVVYGNASVNVGSSYETDKYTRDEINIKGTIFGGGEANSEGSEFYDYQFISVTSGIDVDIDGKDYDGTLHLNGSIFGSGNASSSSGTSNMKISNIGKDDDIIKLISIQRTNNLIIDNSVLEITGATDRTNEYSSIKYSFNRIDLLKIKNDTTLYLQENANLLKELRSLVDEGEKEVKASVTISEDGKVTRNVDNRIYMLADKKLNVTTNETASSYGEIYGMTFLGMYTKGDTPNKGMYGKDNAEDITLEDMIFGGSYILGLHAANYDNTRDGFYSNFANEDYSKVITKYIEPTPEDASYYMWPIGIETINYSVYMTASKYSSLGTFDLKMLDFAKGNSRFKVVSVDTSNLADGVNLIDPINVPKIGENEKETNYTYGLAMKTETVEWTSKESTIFTDEEDGTIKGALNYLTDSTSESPTLTFYLYHAKNISLDAELGEVKITLQAIVPKNEIEYDISFVTINVSIGAKTYSDDPAYDASISYGKKYEMPSLTAVNITNDGSFTAYYSLIAKADYINQIYGNGLNSYHVLSSSYALPVGTQITMLDLSGDNPKYYYYKVNETNYNEKLNELKTGHEAVYRLSDFIAMGSLSENNKYNDYASNQSYYHQSAKLAYEEFLFIVDFKEANIEGEVLDNTLIMELRTSEDRTSYSVLGLRQDSMKYSLYDSTNVELKTTIDYDDNYLYHDIDKEINYKVNVVYDKNSDNESIIDTNYENNAMGLNISLIDSSNNVVNSSLLVGTNITIDEVSYYPSSDGIFRIKLANKVSNYQKKIIVSAGNSLPTGVYKIKFDLFSSSDGLHKTKSETVDEIEFIYVGNNNSIDAKIDEANKLIELTKDETEKKLNVTINYKSELINPNIRVSLYKRNIDEYSTIEYTEVNFKEYATNNFVFPSSYGYEPSTKYEYIVSNSPKEENIYTYNLKEDIESGTYKLVYRLYDGANLIEEDEEYFIISKYSWMLES